MERASCVIASRPLQFRFLLATIYLASRYGVTMAVIALADAARKIELSYRQAKVAEKREETKQVEPVTIQ